MTTTKKTRKMTKLEKAEKKNIDHNKKLATKARKKLSTTLNWMDVKKVDHDCIIIERNKKKYYIKGIKIKPHNLFLDEQAIQMQWLEKIRFAFNQLNCDMWFGFVYSPVNLDAYLNELNSQIAYEEDPTCKNMMHDDLQKAYDFEKYHAEKEFFLMIRDDDQKRLFKNLEDLYTNWANSDFEPVILNQRDYYSYLMYTFENTLINDYVFSRGIFTYENISQEFDAVNNKYVTLDKTNDFRQYGDPIYNIKNDADLNLIQRSKLAPTALKIHRDCIEMGDKWIKNLLAINLPAVYGPAILTQYLNDPNIKVFMSVKHSDYELTKMLNKDYNKRLDQLSKSQDETEKQRIIQALQSQKSYIDDVVRKNDKTFNVTIIFRVSGESKKEVTERAKRLKERLMTEGWQVQGVAGLQEGLLKCATPLFVNNGIEPIIEENIGFPLTSDSIAGLYPFIFETLYDKKGILLGEELQNGGKIVIDPYYYIHEPKLASRNNRINGNFVIVGTAGSGKTTATNLLIRDCIKEKKLTIWIDPENKNDKLTKHYGGTFIDWGKKGNIINPFDLKPISFDEDDDSYSEDDVYDTDQAIKNNIEDIKQIFAYLYPNISDNELSLIGSIVIGAYEKVGIYPDENGKYPSFKTMTVDDMPTFTEFGSALEDAIQVGKEVKDAEVVIDALKRLEIKLMSILNEWSVYFNGHTTVKPLDSERNIISFGTKKLQVVSEQLQKALYHIMFTYSWTLCLDENVESAFIVDEAHTIVLKGQLASLLSQFVRRSRKYKNCMFIITQEPRDFADERVLTDGKAIFNNSAYKLVLGLKQDACMELQKLERINESESFWIQHFTQGCALLIVGDRRIPIHVIATKAELTEMGAMFS